MDVRRTTVTVANVALGALLVVGALVTLASGSRDVPTDAPLDDSAQAQAAIDRAMDLVLAALEIVAAGAVLLALRTWGRTDRWTLPFLCDLGVGAIAILLVSPVGPVVGGLTTLYLLGLTGCAVAGGAPILSDRPWTRWSGG